MGKRTKKYIRPEINRADAVRTFSELTASFSAILKKYCCESNEITVKPEKLTDRSDYIHAKSLSGCQ